MTKKQFNELTPKGQKARLTKYANERAARGTEEVLARLVKPATIKTIKDDNQLAVFRLAVYNKESQKTEFFTASAFIEKGKDALRNFYASLAKGQLVSVEYKQSNGYTNIYNMMKRDSKKSSAKAEVAEQQEMELEA